MPELDKEKHPTEEKIRPKNASEAFDSLLDSVGNGGFWQYKITVLCGFCGIFTSFHNMGAVFLAATPDHLCDLPFAKQEAPDVYSVEEMYNFTIPWVTDKEGNLKLSGCDYYDRNYDEISIQNLPSDTISGNNSGNTFYALENQNGDLEPDQKQCSRWTYNQTVFNSTVVTEWNLVCSEQWWKPSIQASYMMGILAGAVIGSAFSDRFGRRPATIASAVIFFVSSIIVTFSNSLGMFMIFRFIVAGAGQSMYLINFVMVMEICGVSKRNRIGHIYGLFWICGCIWLTFMAYLLRDWRSLQLSVSVPNILLLCYYWFMPESPRWLLMQGKSEEGIALLKQIGKSNGGKELPEKKELDYALDVIKDEVSEARKKLESLSFVEKLMQFGQNVASLVRTPNMRRRSLIIFYNWFVVSMCYYGMGFSGANINVSLYTMSWIGALVEIPGTYFCYITAVKFGRRITLCLSMCLAGLSCIAILIVPTHIGWLKMLFALLGRAFLGSGFVSVFFFSTELVPTNIRNVSIGIASMHARIGSGIAPYITDILGEIYYAIPSTIFGVLSLIAGLLALLLPETSGVGLPETIEEIESLPK